MKKVFIFFLFFTSISYATVVPVNSPDRVVLDELLPYQWGLLNEGQTLIQEKDDIHNVLLSGKPGHDIGWKNIKRLNVDKRPIIALLDSGVDLNHPELQGNLWKNDLECGSEPIVDNDGNQLAGDCDGWNFTMPIDSKEAKDPSDFDGHGTHIAGIMAALNNNSGIVGVIPQALIMPIKVMRDVNTQSNVPSSESFARGILYAVDNGADVINMSLGWPRSLETKALRDAVFYALKKGVPIVAAAGNNNSSGPLYPCAYDGVICVAASTINGDFASFSNFGGHVDTVAPGDGILGLHPILFEPEFFSVPGFELRSGTSQAAPFVSSIIAYLKALDPNLTITEIFGRLYQTQTFEKDGKFILGGMASWETLSKKVTKPIIRPVFKNLRQIIFNGDNTSTEFSLRIRNFGMDSEDVRIILESESSGLEFSSSTQLVSLKNGEFKDLKFRAFLKDMTSESNFRLRVLIETADTREIFYNDVPVARDLNGSSRLKKATFSFVDKALPVGVFKEGKMLPLISTLDSHKNSEKHEFFMRRTLEEDNKLELTLFTKKMDQYVQNDKVILINDAKTLVNFLRVDLNFDGEEDYFVQTVGEKDNEKFFQYSFFNSELDPLWPSFQHIPLKINFLIEKLNQISFIKFNHPQLGRILVPAYVTRGVLPKEDQNLSSWDRVDTSVKKRLYYLRPETNEFKLRSLTSKNWEEKIKERLSANWFETVEIEGLLFSSDSDREQGVLRLLISMGIGTKRKLFIQSFDGENILSGPSLPQLVLQTEGLDPLLSLTPTGPKVMGDVFFNIYDRTRGRLVITNNYQQLGEYVIEHDFDKDILMGHIATFKREEGNFSIFQSKEKLISILHGNTEIKSTRPKLRYSFLSQKLLSEMYYPVSYKRDNAQHPALYVDSTSITGDKIYLLEEQKGKLVSSIKNSISLTPNCKALNPHFNQQTQSFEFIFLCWEKNQFVIRSAAM